MALIDVVRFDGLKSRDWLIFKFPSEELVLGTQLIVQEKLTAIVFILCLHNFNIEKSTL